MKELPQNYSRMGGYASILIGILFLIIPAIRFLSISIIGVSDIKELSNPMIMLPFISENPLIALLILIAFALAGCLIFVVLAVDERIRQHAPRRSRIARIVGFAVSPMILSVGVIGFLGIMELSRLYKIHVPGVGGAFIGIKTVVTGLALTAIVAIGIWLLLVNWSSLKSDKFPKPLVYAGLTFGLLHLFGLAPFIFIIDAIWFLCLGILLLKIRDQNEIGTG
ncbi:MAG: hypothetical protein B6244_02040 [Candidatus Cloacimonetes bacterium 4572_55]|nr:MAG: hypothetical protein B6244_02040 [Candidatus Cloacimonetes bacterium 4572_55]